MITRRAGGPGTTGVAGAAAADAAGASGATGGVGAAEATGAAVAATAGAAGAALSVTGGAAGAGVTGFGGAATAAVGAATTAGAWGGGATGAAAIGGRPITGPAGGRLAIAGCAGGGATMLGPVERIWGMILRGPVAACAGVWYDETGTAGAAATGAAGVAGRATTVWGGATTAGRVSTGGADLAAVSACLRSRIAFRASPGFETLERSNLGFTSPLGLAEPPERLPPVICVRTFSASSASMELEWVFFSVTPTAVRASRIDLLFTSSSRAKSLIRTLLIRPFILLPYRPQLLISASSR